MIPGSGPWGLSATALTSLALGFFVYLKNPKMPMNRAWLRLSLTSTLWALSTAVMSQYAAVGQAFIWARVSQAAFCFIPVYFLQFAASLLTLEVRQERAIRWNKRLAAVFAVLAFTPLLVTDVQAGLTYYRLYPLAGSFYGVFCAWFIALFGWGLWILVRNYRKQVGTGRNQLRYVIFASVVGFLAFVSMMPLAFGLQFPPAGKGLLVFYLLIAYAMLRWKLMDISVVIKNTLIYASLYSILVGLFVVVVVFAGQLFFYGPQALDRRVIWMCLLALMIVTAVVRPLDSWLKKYTDKLLFQRKFSWQKTLKDASRGMTRVTSVDHLFKLMAHFIGIRLRVTHVGIFQLGSDHYTLKVSRGRSKRPLGMTVSKEAPLVGWLMDKKEVVTVEDIEHSLGNERLFPRRTIVRKSVEEIRDELQRLGAQICVPAFSKQKMLGFLALGDKLSGDPYSQEDLDVLYTLATEGAVALENAQLYEQLVHRMSEIEGLYHREHRLFVHTSIALAAAVDARDPYTHGHTERCTAYAMILVDELLTQPEVATHPNFKEKLNIAALLHDIGKIGVSDEILRKKGRLTTREMTKMKEHSTIGAIILQPIKGMEEVAIAVKAHHERFDGKGYPDGLRGTEIPLMTRIISVADTFDSMTTDRPYRKRLPDAVAVKEIETCSGTQFDPVVVSAFMKAYRSGKIVNRPVEAAQMLR